MNALLGLAAALAKEAEPEVLAEGSHPGLADAAITAAVTAAAAAAAAEGLNVLGGRPAAGGAALRVARERAGGLTAGGLKAGGLKAGGLEPERWWKAAVRKAAQQADWGGGGLEGGKRGEAAACADLVKADRLQRRELPDRGAGTDRRGGCVGHRR